MVKQLKILFVTTDLDPFCKFGGLGDVSRDLPRALFDMGCDVRIILPRHGAIDEAKNGIQLLRDNLKVEVMGEEIIYRIKESSLYGDIPVYFVDKHRFFGSRSRPYNYPDENLRYWFFCRAVLDFLDRGSDWVPDIIHCNDWHTGLIPYFLKEKYAIDPHLGKTRTLFTIHNLTFQMGRDWWTLPKKETDDGILGVETFARKKGIRNVNFMRRGILEADMVNTVSEHYAQEIVQPILGQNLDQLLVERMKGKTFFGIVNGIDYRAYNPMTDPGLVSQYGVENIEDKTKNKISLQKEYHLKVGADIPLLGMVARITEQKGFDLLMEIIEPLLKLDLELIIVGDGDKRYKNFFSKIAGKYPRKMVAHMHFKRENVTRIYAATDMFLMPSRFEPCGLGQLISLRYGSVPIAHLTGGLSDTIQNYNPKTGKGNGFTFGSYDSMLFLMTIVRALETFHYEEIWRRIAQSGMRASFSWEVPAKKYRLLYGKTLRVKK